MSSSNTPLTTSSSHHHNPSTNYRRRRQPKEQKNSVSFSSNPTTLSTQQHKQNKNAEEAEADADADAEADDDVVVDISSSFRRRVDRSDENYGHSSVTVSAKRKNDDIDDDDDDDDHDHDNYTVTDTGTGTDTDAKRQQRRCHRRTNGDRDVEDGDNNGDNNIDDFNQTVIDQHTSLGVEGVEIEPFHMKQEESDGLGYFDGDTYVFRRKKEEEEQPDAWLDSLDEQQQPLQQQQQQQESKSTHHSCSSTTTPPNFSRQHRQELIANMIPFVSDTETVLQALVRYGNLLQAIRKQQQRLSKQKLPSVSSTIKSSIDDDDHERNVTTKQMAQSSLNALTQASNQLMIQHGMMDVYQQTRQDLLQLLSVIRDDEPITGATLTAVTIPIIPAGANNNNNTLPARSAEGVVVQWEYMGNEDGQVHGPFSTADMLAWTRAGYFRHDHAVQLRSITTSTSRNNSNSNNSHESLQADLLADLMDDENDDDNARRQQEQQENTNDLKTNHDNGIANLTEATVVVRGEWISSNNVDFAAVAFATKYAGVMHTTKI